MKNTFAKNVEKILESVDSVDGINIETVADKTRKYIHDTLTNIRYNVANSSLFDVLTELDKEIKNFE
jgi:hypothetical protein